MQPVSSLGLWGRA